MIRACCYIVAVWMGLSLSTARADRDVTGDIARVSDPCIIKADGKYYIFCSGPGVPIRESRDLIAWKQTGIVFPEMPAWAKEHVPGAKGFWAPDISFRDGVYYLYYAVSTLGSRRSVIGLATNTTLDSFRPEYHWQDRGLVIESHSTDDYNAIDPNVIRTPEGQLWLAFGSYWGGLKMVALEPTTGKPDPNARLLSIAARPPAKAIEGVFIFRHSGYYYLFASHDFTGRGLDSTYKIVVGRSDQVTGPYKDRDGRSMLAGGGTLLVAGDSRWRGAGHNAVLKDGIRTWLVYHALDATHSAELDLRIEDMHWSADGWPEVAKRVGPVVGYWDHRVADGPLQQIRLLPGGKINTPANASTNNPTWRLTGENDLELHWPNPNAPGGEYVDRCKLDAAHRSYSGANAQGVTVHGVVSVVGCWEHSAGGGDAVMIHLLPDGKIDSAAGKATWKLHGNTLELHWPSATAAIGEFVDRCSLSPDRSTYTGTNQLNVPIHGLFISSE